MLGLRGLMVVALAAVVLPGCPMLNSSDGPSALPQVEDQTFYLQRNAWFYEGVHDATNYHLGVRVPVNTRVTITDTGSGTITFRQANGDGPYTIENIHEYSQKDLQGLFERYFGDAPVALDRFAPDSRRAITEGRVITGMSRDAVLLARGYPPAHETASLEDDSWRYWVDRHDTRLVHFRDGQVTRIQD